MISDKKYTNHKGRVAHDYDKELWITTLKVGDYIWDCRYKRRKITKITITGSKDKHLDFRDGSCSARHCADKYKWA